MIKAICVYCGSSDGSDPAYSEAAKILGRMMAEHNIRLVYGGGTKGIMGTVSQAVKDHGGQVSGIIPRFLMDKEATEDALDSMDELIVTETMHQRKQLMFERSDAFIVLPGGIGTLEEIVEMMTWAQLGHHNKPMVFANIKGFWNPMHLLIQHMVAQGFIHTAHLVAPLMVDDAERLISSVMTTSSFKT